MSKCRICRQPFQKRSISHKDCSPECAIEGIAIDKAKKAAKQHKADKLRLKTRAEWMKEAQQSFNAFIRERDKGRPCISCGTTSNIQYCAGHYRTVGSCPELRFEPLNVHLQCNRNCNMAKSGNIIEYRINLIKKIGLEKVEWLEGCHAPKKYTIDELQAIKAEYKEKVKRMQK